MRNFIYYTLLSVLISALILAALFASAVVERPLAPGSVDYSLISADEYQSLIRNWDEAQSPLLYAYVRSIEEYRQLFVPAPRRKAGLAIEPESSLFESEAILIVAWVQALSHDPFDVFSVDRLSKHQDELILDYRYNEIPDSSSFYVIRYAALRVARGEYKRVILRQNGTIRGRLALERGQWINVRR